jgi:hypothetical protein
MPGVDRVVVLAPCQAFAPGIWEIAQAGAAELFAPGRYRLTRLPRGQRGTEAAMGNPTPAGARVVVVLDAALAPLPITEADPGLPRNWRVGPASRWSATRPLSPPPSPPKALGCGLFSVGHIEQPRRFARSPGDPTIRWTRR